MKHLFSYFYNKTTVRLLSDLMILTQSNILYSYATLVFMIWARIILLYYIIYIYIHIYISEIWYFYAISSWSIHLHFPNLWKFFHFFFLLTLPPLVYRFFSLLDAQLSTVTDGSLFPLKKPTVQGC